jgi:hypothetical protein
VESGRIRSLNTGLTDIARWRESDEVHLPTGRTLGLPFLPEMRPLDSILRRETLEERLAGLVLPSRISASLAEPGALRRAREAMAQRFRKGAGRSLPQDAAALEAAEALLERETELDEEVQMALAALLRA